jgi:hypothetical protein
MEILSDKIVTTRKSHLCNACHRRFEKGTIMRSQVNTYDGIGTWRECPTCTILLDKHRDCFSDEYNVCEDGCVNESLDKGETPEDLLIRLSNRKS